MFIDANALVPGTELDADICIVGGGAAGITLAKDLGQRGITTLLLEAGGVEPDDVGFKLFDGDLLGEDYPLAGSRLRYFGGSTNHWGGLCRPLDPIDFRSRPWVPMSGWPVRWDELVPWYELAHKTCELDRFDYSLQHWESGNRRELPLSAGGFETTVLQFSTPTRFGMKYRSDLEKSPDTRIVFNAALVKIHTNEARSRIERLQIRASSSETLFARAKAYVLACGGIENPRLMLRSGYPHSAGIGNSSGLVGRCFMEHPHMMTGYLVPNRDISDELSFYTQLGTRHGEHTAWRVYRRLMRAIGRVVGTSRALYRLQDASQERDELLGFSVMLIPMTESSELDPEIFAYVTDGAHIGEREFYFVRTITEQAPDENSFVELGDDLDDVGLPRIRLNWQLNAQDLKTIRLGNRLLASAFARAGLGRAFLFDWVHDAKAKPPGIGWGYHHMGTTRMGHTSETSVVDRNCRSHDVSNLYVAGSSVFPTGGVSNPTLTIVALAHRLANHLAEQV